MTNRKPPVRRVYVRDGSYYWVQPYTERWKKLCRVEDGEVRMLERLAAEKAKVEKIDGTGNIPHWSTSMCVCTRRTTRKGHGRRMAST